MFSSIVHLQQNGLSFLVISIVLFLPSIIQPSSSQLSSLSNPPNVNQQSVTYQKQSNFIHEFSLPQSVNERGLKGITTDSQGNPWFYHQTNKTSMIMKFNLANNTFNSYLIEGKTVTDNPIINLAGGQIIFDEKRNSLWFSDARVNVLGKLDLKNGNITLTKIPTNNSGNTPNIIVKDIGSYRVIFLPYRQNSHYYYSNCQDSNFSTSTNIQSNSTRYRYNNISAMLYTEH